jgi:seryl-tRNA synthetase
MAIDFERGAKTTGSKFYFLTGEDAVREFRLIQEMIEFHTKNGYTLVIPPYLINQKTAEQAGILPRFKGDFYETDNFLLIPTAETPLVWMHSDEIFQEDELPIKYVAFSPCFRKEAGAPGQRDKGLKRVHQFHKVELFCITKPQDSEALHNKMVEEVEQLLDTWSITHRRVELTAEDRSPVSNKTIDIEILAGDEWLEVSSISNTGENQSKPAQIRYKPKTGGKNIKCHLLNGSGVALPRLHLALLSKMH